MLFKALRVGGLTQVAPEAGSRREKVQEWGGHSDMQTWYWQEGCPSRLTRGRQLGGRGAKAMVWFELKSQGVERICQGVSWVCCLMRVPLLSVVMNFK